MWSPKESRDWAAFAGRLGPVQDRPKLRSGPFPVALELKDPGEHQAVLRLAGIQRNGPLHIPSRLVQAAAPEVDEPQVRVPHRVLGRHLDEAVARIDAQLPVGVRLERVADQPRAVARSVGEFVRVLIEAVVIVMAVSLLSLGLRTGVVVLVPESGDAIQTMKAGLMEAADVFVVNKADRPGAPALVAELRFNVHLHLSSPAAATDVTWEIPVLTAEAQNGVGIAELFAAIRAHRSALETSGALESRRRTRRRSEFGSVIARGGMDALLQSLRERIAQFERETTR